MTDTDVKQTFQDATPLKEIDILWITAGLGCDGESIAMTAATQPSIEDLVLGSLPGIPRIKLHNPVFAYENGDDFRRKRQRAASFIGTGHDR